MRRREFIAFAGGAAVASSLLWPLAVRAQATGSVRKVGVLLSGVESDPDSQVRIAAFRRGFADLGWKEGDNAQIEYRWSAGKSDLIRQYAEELVALKPDVILANSTPVIAMLKSMTNSIPIACAHSSFSICSPTHSRWRPIRSALATSKACRVLVGILPALRSSTRR